MKSDNVILSIKNLKKVYQDISNETVALDNLSFDVYDKEFISLVGPSGCGKSTLLSILSGFDNNYSGNLKYKNKLKIGYMLQDDALLPWRNVLDNCLFGLEVENKITDNDRNYVISLLKKYGLEDFIYKYPDSLSGGMRQRVALIRTLVLKPDLLLLDEPLSALDSQIREEIGNDILNIIKNEKKTAIMITHDISEALSISDRILVFSKRPGKIIKEFNLNMNDLDYFDRQRDNKFYLLKNEIRSLING